MISGEHKVINSLKTHLLETKFVDDSLVSLSLRKNQAKFGGNPCY